MVEPAGGEEQRAARVAVHERHVLQAQRVEEVGHEPYLTGQRQVRPGFIARRCAPSGRTGRRYRKPSGRVEAFGVAQREDGPGLVALDMHEAARVAGALAEQFGIEASSWVVPFVVGEEVEYGGGVLLEHLQ